MNWTRASRRLALRVALLVGAVIGMSAIGVVHETWDQVGRACWMELRTYRPTSMASSLRRGTVASSAKLAAAG